MDKDEIQKQFNLIAKEYDENRHKFISCFDDLYKTTTEFVANCIKRPKRILDLGSGTGLLAMYWYHHFPEAEFVLNDISDDMLAVAKERFAHMENVSTQIFDYSEELPDLGFNAVISALSIHHLEDQKKRDFFRELYQKLPKDGVFVNYDQFNAENQQMREVYNNYWVNSLKTSGLTQEDIEKWKERRKLDKECSIQEEVSMLSSAGFSCVECIYNSQKFAVILAKK